MKDSKIGEPQALQEIELDITAYLEVEQPALFRLYRFFFLKCSTHLLIRKGEVSYSHDSWWA